MALRTYRTQKVHEGVNCYVREVTEGSIGLAESTGDSGNAHAYIDFDGASCLGFAYADSGAFSSTGAASILGIGWVKKKFEIVRQEGCEAAECTIELRFKASGGLHGYLSDNTMSAHGRAELSVGGKPVSVNMELEPKKEAGGGANEVGATTTASGTAPGGVAINGTLTYSKKWEDTTGATGSIIIQSIDEARSESCLSRSLIVVESRTVVSLAARNRDWTMERCMVNVGISNEIETERAACVCNCPEPAKTSLARPREFEELAAMLPAQIREVDEVLALLRGVKRGPASEAPPHDRIQSQLLKQLQRATETVYSEVPLEGVLAMRKRILEEGAQGMAALPGIAWKGAYEIASHRAALLRMRGMLEAGHVYEAGGFKEALAEARAAIAGASHGHAASAPAKGRK